MSKTISEPGQDQAATHQQIIANAERNIAELERESGQISTCQAEIATEREQLRQASAVRSLRLEQARQKAMDARSALEQQRVHVKLATGTKLEKQANEPIKAQTEHLAALIAERDEMEHEAARLEHEEAARLAVLLEQEREFTQRLPTIASEMQASHQVRLQARKELGQAIYRDTHLRLQQADDQVGEIKKQMDAAQAARESVLKECFARLADWPELVGELSLQIPLSDPVIRILEAEVAYLEALLKDGRELPPQIHEVAALRNHRWSANQLLIVPASETESVWSHTQSLQTHRDTLVMVLAQYRQHHLTASAQRAQILAAPVQEVALAKAFI